jgi:tetratricopeptide (TPR) repeat protein
MKRLLYTAAVGFAVLETVPGEAIIGSADPAEVARAITKLDVARAQELLSASRSDTPELAMERARLSIYLGDCDAAAATLGGLEASEQVSQLSSLAKSCARGTAGSVVVEDRANGVWLRLQDDEDRALVPFLVDVASRARAAVERDMGTNLPRPLRIDLVRDLFTLSAVSGLPVEAAETTGTVAVARWGRVTMLSPRAAPYGYPWEDTLTHELTHLALSRATRDFAPLWLQEGLAKRSETRWRPERPFDDRPNATEVARRALESGESVGVDALGPSIAMLPSPQAASIAFAEVESFVRFLIDTAGLPALQLFLIDLEGLESREADEALLSVTGYDLAAWIARWQQHLRGLPAPAQTDDVATVSIGEVRGQARSVRLGDLLFSRGELEAAAESYQGSLRMKAVDPSVKWRAGRSLLAIARPEDAARALGELSDLNGGHAGWYAVSARLLEESGRDQLAGQRFGLGLSLNPFLEDAACEGHFLKPGSPSEEPLPADPARRALCEAARKMPRE